MTEWTFKGAAKPLEDVDLPRIAKTIGCGEDELHAIMDVEAAGSGFDSKGRPKMLFEPHIFYRLLGPGKARDEAVKQGLAYPKWKAKGYPADSYDRLQRAMKINAVAALMSASWGAFQIMGFNHGAAGYASPEEMVRDFMDDADNHVEAVVRFLVNKKLDDDLRAHRWGVIEEVYNGGGFNGAYARKLEKAFAKWQKIKDTPLPVEKPAITPPILTKETPPVVQATPAPPKAENQPVTPPAQPGSPVAEGAGGAAVVAAAASTLFGVPWWVAGAIGVAILVAVIAYLNLRKSE